MTSNLFMATIILRNYSRLIDNLPCATKYIMPDTGEVFYDHGYKLGWVDASNGKVFVNNHLDIVLKYHEPTSKVYRVVGFEVHARSIDSASYNSEKEKVKSFFVI